MRFTGWKPAAVTFFEGLAADNSKAYWQANKAVYEAEVAAPMEGLLAELADEFGDGKVFRPYRDVRFSKDKSPYKTAIAATLESGGYVQFSAEGLGVGAGYYVMSPPQLARFRAAIDADGTGAELESIMADLRGDRIDATAHDTLKTAPRGYPKDHPRIELLRMKGAIAWKQWPYAKWQATAAAKGRVVGVLEASVPLRAWLDTNVGPQD